MLTLALQFTTMPRIQFKSTKEREREGERELEHCTRVINDSMSSSGASERERERERERE